MLDWLKQKLELAKQRAFNFVGFYSAIEPDSDDGQTSSPRHTCPTMTSLQDGETAPRKSQSRLKRPSPHDEVEAQNDQDVGGVQDGTVQDGTAQDARAQDSRAPKGTQKDHQEAASDDEWQTVTRPHKRCKKAKKMPRPGKSYPALTFSPNARLQTKVNLNQLRDLVTYIFADGTGPQWINVSHRPQFRKIVTIMVPGLDEFMFKQDVDLSTYQDEAAEARGFGLVSPDDYYPRLLEKDRIAEPLQPFADMFTHLWPVKTPSDEKHGKMHSPLTTFLTLPLAKDKLSRPGGVKPAVEPRGWKNERTPITNFMASVEELVDNGFLVHPALLAQDQRDSFVVPEGWVVTKVDRLEQGEVPDAEIEQGSMTAGREVLALDCEMCLTGPDEFSLTRISIVNWNGDVVMDELVKPDKPIVDYLTQYSGITRDMLAPVTTTLADIQHKLLGLLHPRTIVVGHSLEADCKAIRMAHPFLVDSSLLFPHPRGPPLKSSLKWLAAKYLQRSVQQGGAAGHNSIEDARTCLDLVKQKCEKGSLWGTSDLQAENLFRRLARAGTAYKAQGGDAALGGLEVGKTSAAVDWGDPSRSLGAGATHCFGCNSDDDVETNVVRALLGDADGRLVSGGGVDFVWARMREVELVQGWWNRNRSHGEAAMDAPAEPAQAPPPPPDVDAAAAPPPSSSSYSSPLEDALARLAQRLRRIYGKLPPCTALIVYSGSGDPRAMARLQQMHARWRKEYNTPGSQWDQLSILWTDAEDQQLRRAVQRASAGIGFLAVK